MRRHRIDSSFELQGLPSNPHREPDPRFRASRLTVPLLLYLLSVPTLGLSQEWIERDIFRASNGRPNHQFGFSVSVSGDTAIVGAIQDNGGRGATYLFDTATGQELLRLTASDGKSGDRFGWEVGLSGDTAIVGAWGNDGNGRDAGAAYLFDVATGEELFKLSPSDPVARAEFGADLDLDGNTAIVGSQNFFVDRPGAAYVYDTSSGEELFKLTASDGHDDDLFGRQVAIDGMTAMVGGRAESGIYVYDLKTGAETSNIDVWGDWISDISLDGDLAVVGAFQNDDSKYGTAYVFDISSGELIHELSPPTPKDREFFGFRVAISGNTAVIGNNLNHRGSGPGTAYVFDLTTGELTQELRGSIVVENDLFGRDVAIDGGSIVVGAEADQNRTLPGRAYFYVPESLPGDFDSDSLLTASDIDLLSEVIRLEGSNLFFDLNNDDELNAADRDTWVEDLAGTLSGDANLDKSVDFNDFLTLSNAFGQPGGWADGDFDGSGEVAFPDFLLLSENFGKSAAAVTSVPEPNAISILLGGGLFSFFRKRVRR